MRRGTCDVACNRCVSSERKRLLRRTLLVSARQAEPCADAGADAWVMRAMQNHAEYARAHGMTLSWTSSLVDADFAGAWNKIAYLSRLMRSRLLERSDREEFLLWADWDVIFTDVLHELPLEEYAARGARLVLGGDPATLSEAQPDYLKVNTGVLLLRVHNWSLALLERVLQRGGRTRQQRRRRGVEIQSSVKNLCVGCIDDQAVLLEMLHKEGARWAAHTLLERRFALQGHWEDFADAIPDEPGGGGAASSAVAAPPLRQPRAPPLAPLRKRVFGSVRVPLAVHFAGCQLCSGTAPEKAPRCWPAFRRVLRFAEDVALRPLGVRHDPSSNASLLPV